LKRLGEPETTVTDVHVSVPAEALNEPVTVRFPDKEMFDDVVTDPEIVRAVNEIDPDPEIVAPLPDKVTIPVVAAKDPETDRFPAIVIVRTVVTEPVTVRLLSVTEAATPPMVCEVPPIVKIPAPPAVWVSFPDPEVTMLPVTVRFIALLMVTPAPVITRLSNVVDPLPEITAFVPVMYWAAEEVNVPLFVQVLAHESSNVEALSVAPALIVTGPVTRSVPPCVALTEVPAPWFMVNAAAINMRADGRVFTDAPLTLLNVRLL
jgi:hypothetical protein